MLTAGTANQHDFSRHPVRVGQGGECFLAAGERKMSNGESSWFNGLLKNFMNTDLHFVDLFSARHFFHDICEKINLF